MTTLKIKLFSDCLNHIVVINAIRNGNTVIGFVAEIPLVAELKMLSLQPSVSQMKQFSVLH